MLRVDQTLLQQVIVSRPSDSYKGDYGRLLLIGGTYPYGGAIMMAALAAVHSGAGLVTVATDQENIPALHSQLPEAMAFAVTDQELLAEQIAKAGALSFAFSSSASGLYSSSKRMGGHVRYSDWRPRGRSNKAGSIPTSSSKYSGPKGTPD